MLLGMPSKPSEMLRGYPGSRAPSSKRQYWLPWGCNGDGGGGQQTGVESPGTGALGTATVIWGHLAPTLKRYVLPWQLMRVKAASMGPSMPQTSLMSLG